MQIAKTGGHRWRSTARRATTSSRGGIGTDLINGLGGDDDLFGQSGDDVLKGGDGDDRLVGGRGTDTLVGGGGDDRFDAAAAVGGDGVDHFDGGDGVDSINYFFLEAEFPLGVTVDLALGIGSGGEANGDTYSGIEDVAGTSADDVLIGSTVANRLEGREGDDLLVGGGGDDFLSGTRGRDTLDGGAGRDVLEAGDGDQLGADSINGGADRDTVQYLGASSGISINLATGATAGAATGDTLIGIESLGGSSFSDGMEGDAGANGLDGFDGNDTLRGRGGADSLDGGDGIDRALYTDSAAGVSVDLLVARQIGGDAEGDVINEIENIEGSAFADVLRGDDAVANRLTGNDGGDFLFGRGGDDTLLGGRGQDILNGGAGRDVLDGGQGADTVSYGNSDGAVTIVLNAGGTGGDANGDVLRSIEDLIGSDFADLLFGDLTANTLSGGTGNDTLAASGFGVFDVAQQGDLLRGQEGDDHLIGAAGNDGLLGGIGADWLYGGKGNDLLDGEIGADRMTGGLGDDTYRVNALGDVVTEAPGGGIDLVESSISLTLGAELENLLLTGTADRSGDGNGLANGLFGNGGANTLSGRAGDDRLFGAFGKDLLIGGAGKDVFDYNFAGESPTGTGRDTIQDFTRGADRIDVSGIDANTDIAGNQAFTFIGAALFSRAEGELRVSATGILQGDTDGDGTADFQVALIGITALAAADLVL